MTTDITKYSESIFEDIKRINEYGQEYWTARELQHALEYSEWRNFESIINARKDDESHKNTCIFVKGTLSFKCDNKAFYACTCLPHHLFLGSMNLD